MELFIVAKITIQIMDHAPKDCNPDLTNYGQNAYF